MTAPSKNYELLSFATSGELAHAAASAWLDEIESAHDAGKLYCVALSGGRITKTFFALVAQQAKAGAISFAHVHFFWADERCVPAGDPESNFRMADELLFAPLGVSKSLIHRIRGEDAPANAVKTAVSELRNIVPPNEKGQPVLDLVLLGMGEDGHVASLFPDAPAEVLNCTVPFLCIDNSPKPPPRRISLSYSAIAAAKQVWVLISGAGKEKALRQSLEVSGKMPLAQVIQSRSQTRIFSEIRPN